MYFVIWTQYKVWTKLTAAELLTATEEGALLHCRLNTRVTHPNPLNREGTKPSLCQDTVKADLNVLLKRQTQTKPTLSLTHTSIKFNLTQTVLGNSK